MSKENFTLERLEYYLPQHRKKAGEAQNLPPPNEMYDILRRTPVVGWLVVGPGPKRT